MVQRAHWEQGWGNWGHFLFWSVEGATAGGEGAFSRRMGQSRVGLGSRWSQASWVLPVDKAELQELEMVRD